MNRSKKGLLLVIAFVLPFILILLFEFGSKNVYEVPLLYEEGVKNIPTGCSFKYPTPYVLPDTVLHKLQGETRSTLTIISFDSLSAEGRQNLNRIREQFSSDSVFIKDADSYYNSLAKCVFLINGSDSSLVLVDSSGRIRGYYNGRKREDVDRLRNELTIILKKY